MKMRILFICLISIVWSCSHSPYIKVEQTSADGKLLYTCLIDTMGGKSDTLEKTEYYPNGQIRVKGTFKNNLRDGEWTYYFENGNIWSKGTFRDGKSDGIFTIYNKDGSLFMKSSYKMGRPDGKWQFYENNKLKREVYFSNDSIVKEINY